MPEDIEAHPWQPEFVDEVTSFTGTVGKEQDDQTDALVGGEDGALYIDDLGVLGGGGRYSGCAVEAPGASMFVWGVPQPALLRPSAPTSRGDREPRGAAVFALFVFAVMCAADVIPR